MKQSGRVFEYFFYFEYFTKIRINFKEDLQEKFVQNDDFCENDFRKSEVYRNIPSIKLYDYSLHSLFDRFYDSDGNTLDLMKKEN